MNKETIEEAANRILSKEGVKLHPSGLETYLKGNVINAMVEMAKWQTKAREVQSPIVKQLLDETTLEQLDKVDKQMGQTTIEWLEEEFIKLESTIGVHGVMYELLERAKTMERQQMKEMYLKGIENYDPTFKRREEQ